MYLYTAQEHSIQTKTDKQVMLMYWLNARIGCKMGNCANRALSSILSYTIFNPSRHLGLCQQDKDTAYTYMHVVHER